MANQRVTGDGWEVHPIEHPLTAAWSLNVSKSDVSRLIRGFKPNDMDDRWMCKTDGPDKRGRITVHIYRSWTGHEYFELKAILEHRDGKEKVGGKIVEIKWEQGDEHNKVDEKEAKDRAVGLCRGMLKCKLDAIP